jgi:hypothetical protein
VAVALVAALVAVPVVLSKSSEAPPPAPANATDAKRTAPEPSELKGLTDVKLEKAALDAGSSLDTFDPSNPFRPPAKVIRGPKQATAGADSGPSPDSGNGSGGDAVIDKGNGGGNSGGGPGDTGGGDTGGGTTGGGDTGGGGTTTTTQYRYVIDVTFWAGDRKRRIDAMERLRMLPNANKPLLLFLGVSSDGGNAVFLVDSTLEAAGEGECKPNNEECSFLYLGPGSEHAFTNEQGDSYAIRVDEIRRVKVKNTTKAAASSKNKKTAKAAVGRPAPTRRFVLPMLADLVSVSSPRGGGSNRNRDSR